MHIKPATGTINEFAESREDNFYRRIKPPVPLNPYDELDISVPTNLPIYLCNDRVIQYEAIPAEYPLGFHDAQAHKRGLEYFLYKRLRMNKESPPVDRSARCTASGNAPALVNGPAPAEKDETGMYKDHWVLCDEERAKDKPCPVRTDYTHTRCGHRTIMGRKIAETYARDPGFYSTTFCAHCRDYFPVGKDGEFEWRDGTKVGTPQSNQNIFSSGAVMLQKVSTEENFMSTANNPVSAGVPITEEQLQKLIDDTLGFVENRLKGRPIIRGVISEAQSILDHGGLQALYSYLKSTNAIV